MFLWRGVFYPYFSCGGSGKAGAKGGDALDIGWRCAAAAANQGGAGFVPLADIVMIGGRTAVPGFGHGIIGLAGVGIYSNRFFGVLPYILDQSGNILRSGAVYADGSNCRFFVQQFGAVGDVIAAAGVLLVLAGKGDPDACRW